MNYSEYDESNKFSSPSLIFSSDKDTLVRLVSPLLPQQIRVLTVQYFKQVEVVALNFEQVGKVILHNYYNLSK